MTSSQLMNYLDNFFPWTSTW